MKKENLIFLILIMVSSLGQIISDIYLPSLPILALDLHSTEHAAQFSLSIYLFGFAFSLLIYGPVSDAFGRRKPLLFGLSLCALGSLVCCLAPSMSALIVGRLIQGLGAGATMAIASPILRDIFEGDTLAQYVSYSALISVGFLAVAPLFGGYLQHYLGWRAIFFILTLYTFVTIILLILNVPETNKNPHPDNLTFPVIKKNLLTLFTSPHFLVYCSCSLLAYGALLAWLTAGPIILESVVGLTPVEFGQVYVLTGLGFALGAFINAKKVGQFGINKMIMIGLFCILIAGISMAALALLDFVNSISIITPAILLLFGTSMVFPNSSAGIFQYFPNIAGITSAVFYSTRMLSGSIFSGALAALPDHNQLPMGLAIIISAISAILAGGIFYAATPSKT